MGKTKTIILATLGGIEAAFSIAIPVLVALLWISYSSFSDWSSYTVLCAGAIASVFRAIKVGWLGK
jgi:hypothetical protein